MSPPEDTVSALNQDEFWIHGERIDEMDWKHRSNLIPFLRRNAESLMFGAALRYALSDDAMRGENPDGFGGQAYYGHQAGVDSEAWLEQTPLMQKLLEHEWNLTWAQRKLLAASNKAYELKTGYRKVGAR